VQVNYAYAGHMSDPAALLDAYETLTGWSEAVAAAGATVSVVQAFHYDARISRHDIDYVFCGDSEPAVGPTKTRRRWPRAFEAQVLAAKPDLVHVNSLEFAPEIWRLRRSLPTGTPIVVQDHASGVPRPFSISAPVRRRLLRAADAFLFTAREQADPWRAGRFISEKQAVYQAMESSTRLRAMDRETARSISGVEGRPAVLWVGRLNAIKDPLTILDGFERALGTLPEAVLTMVFGADDLLPAVRRRLKESAALARSVRLVGSVPHDQLAAFYSAADLFVLGSAHESCGYALIEACACGATPVVTNIPPFRVITDNGSIGGLWTHGDAADCARALIAAANSDLNEQRRRMLAHFEQHLSWPVVGRQAVAIYDDLQTRCDAR